MQPLIPGHESDSEGRGVHDDAHFNLRLDAGAALWRQNVELLQQRSCEQEHLLTGQRLSQANALACESQ